MLKDSDRITAVQMFIIIVSTINAIEVIILPRSLVLTVGQDGWIVIIGGHLLSAIVVFFIVKLGLLYPNDTFVEYTPKILGRFLGIPIVAAAAIFWVLICARILRQFADFIQLILPQTPIEVIILTVLLVAGYIVRHGIEPIARTIEILFPVFISILGLLILGSLIEVDLMRLLPILNTSPKILALESIKTSFGLEGQEILLMLLPFMAVPEKAYRAVFGALAFDLGLRLALFVAVIGFFGVELTKTLVWPVEELSRSLTIGGTFIGRFDSFLISLWVTVAFTSILVFLFLASLTVSRIMKFREQSMTVLPLVPLIFIAALLPNSIVVTEEWSDYLSNVWGIYIFTIPPLLLLISYIRGTHKKEKRERLRER